MARGERYIDPGKLKVPEIVYMYVIEGYEGKVSLLGPYKSKQYMGRRKVLETLIYTKAN